ncbi:hypothetical protein chiPu_0017681 [Chiloscyllium punctatum]|uniref:L-type lectin-like domain-containing protein n=1 Tax=Chiloscyllium punctatum TaxID=137246 RepID=A0A401RHZ7_CHIPU|nr:hypothetical protein [Chiloscyllium punctatum]
MPLWDFSGSTMLTGHYVRLTPDERSKSGSIWNRVPCYLKDWELHVQFKVHGTGKKNLHGDGLAIWYTKDRLSPGTVFGSKDKFHGLGLFIDTYPNDESADVMTDVEDKNEWKECIDISGVRLPTGYFFGASAATGDLSDNHDVISMKLYQLTVEHSVEDENIDWTKIEPSVSFLKSPKDNIDDPTGNFRSGPMTGWKIFLLLLCALLGIVVCGMVGAVVFQKRQERNKRFY